MIVATWLLLIGTVFIIVVPFLKVTLPVMVPVTDDVTCAVKVTD